MRNPVLNYFSFTESKSFLQENASKKNGTTTSLEDKPEFKKLLSSSPPPLLSPSGEPPEPEELIRYGFKQRSIQKKKVTGLKNRPMIKNLQFYSIVIFIVNMTYSRVGKIAYSISA